MKASLAWIRRYADLPDDVDALAARLTSAGFVVASAEPRGADTVLDVEVTYNRPDLLCHVGLARELAGLFGSAFREPDATIPPGVGAADVVPVAVEAEELCPVYTARILRGVRVGPSPPWLVAALEAAGQRSVNNVVDVTNFVLLECGQPLHAFDLARLRGPRIVVRRGRSEPMTAIDGRRLVVGADDLAVCDAAGPVAVAGVMGSLESEVTAGSTDVLLESAVFAPLAVRATARRFQIRSEASFRFERHVDVAGVRRASDRAARLLVELCGARSVGPVAAAGPGGVPHGPRIRLRATRVAHVLGTEVPDAEVAAILRSLGLREADGPRDGGDCEWIAPTWRPDLTSEIDLIEEVARRIGFDRIPDRSGLLVEPLRPDPSAAAARRLRAALVGQGMRECISAPFVTEGPRDVALLTDAPSLRVLNPMRADESRLRRSLVGPLAATARRNADRGNPSVRLFEHAPVYLAAPADGATRELRLAAGLVSGDFAEAKGCVEAVLAALGRERDAEFVRGGPPPLRDDRSATVRLDGDVVGVVGELSNAACEALGLAVATSVFELDVERLCRAARLDRPYSRISRYPAVERDIAWVVDEAVPWQALESCAREAGAPLVRAVRFLSEFRGGRLEAGRKSVAFGLELRAEDRTLTGDDADACVRRIVERLAEATGGRLRA